MSPERRFAGMLLSVRPSMKSLTIKSLLWWESSCQLSGLVGPGVGGGRGGCSTENSSREKVLALGKIERVDSEPVAIMTELAGVKWR